MTDRLAQIRSLGIWSGDPDVSVLAGGLSNVNYRVHDARGGYVVRFGEDMPFHHVSRATELVVNRAAGALGLSPEVVHARPGVVVTRFLDARPLDEAGVRSAWSQILPLVRHAHENLGAQLTGRPPFFWVFHVIRDYVATLRAGGDADPALDRWIRLSRSLEIAQAPMPTVFCHNDLLPANVLDDGRRLWLIDWEYAGWGSPLFDLANLAGNATFSRTAELALLHAYFDRPPDADLLRAFDAMKAASLLREALWSRVSEQELKTPGVDYRTHADINFARFERAMADFEANHS